MIKVNHPCFPIQTNIWECSSLSCARIWSSVLTFEKYFIQACLIKSNSNQTSSYTGSKTRSGLTALFWAVFSPSFSRNLFEDSVQILIKSKNCNWQNEFYCVVYFASPNTMCLALNIFSFSFIPSLCPRKCSTYCKSYN